MNCINNLSFSKKIRLLKFYSFRAVFKKSLKLEINEMIILSNKNHLYYPRLGIIISKKVSKYSYQRNLIKRLIRESFRLIQYYLYHIDFIIIVKPGIISYDRYLLIKYLKLLWMYYYQ